MSAICNGGAALLSALCASVVKVWLKGIVGSSLWRCDFCREEGGGERGEGRTKKISWWFLYPMIMISRYYHHL